jgi:uncharacterized protein
MSEHIDVVGTGSASAAPDIAVVDARIQVDAADVAAALAGAAAQVALAVRTATDHAVGEADRRTTGMSLSSRWDREARSVIGYTAHQTLRLVIRDPDRTGDLLAALADCAGDTFGVDNLALEIADRAPLVVAAREAAVADARATAEQLARLTGRTLGRVIRVVDQPGTVPPPMKAARMMAAESSGGMPVAAGESTVTVAVAVRFGFEPE